MLTRICFSFWPRYFCIQLIAFILLFTFWHMADIWLLKFRFLSISLCCKLTDNFLPIFVTKICCFCLSCCWSLTYTRKKYLEQICHILYYYSLLSAFEVRIYISDCIFCEALRMNFSNRIHFHLPNP